MLVDDRAGSGSREPGNVTGLHIVVTGGGRGIGRACAASLAAAGAHVTVVARTRVQVEETVLEIRERGGSAKGFVCDVTVPSMVHDALSAASGWRPVDVLINNAGMNSAFGPLGEVDQDLWWADITVNLRGSALCSAALLPKMVERGSGRIINIVSGAAGRAFPFDTAYGISKAAIVRLTDSLAAEVASAGVSVFALGPGNVDTGLSRSFLTSGVIHRYSPDAVGRFSPEPPDKAIAAISFLSGGAGDMLSGRWVDAADDLQQLVAHAEEIVARDLYQLRRTKL
ncbi:SDR family NAD(P)-dependent oxidoreductase [Williamsia muralis]|nr:SDR family NAD(P)-dependent oxidoreductase [Williamsia marianensis]